MIFKKFVKAKRTYEATNYYFVYIVNGKKMSRMWSAYKTRPYIRRRIGNKQKNGTKHILFLLVKLVLLFRSYGVEIWLLQLCILICNES